MSQVVILDLVIPTVRMTHSCITKYIPPTSCRGARVKVKDCTTRRSITIDWKYELSSFENQSLAALALLQNYDAALALPSASNLLATDMSPDGYIFTIVR